jgi:hypothetical protein
MEKLLHGELTEPVMEEVRRVLPKKNLMVFVSSTFLDTNLEKIYSTERFFQSSKRKLGNMKSKSYSTICGLE